MNSVCTCTGGLCSVYKTVTLYSKWLLASREDSCCKLHMLCCHSTSNIQSEAPVERTVMCFKCLHRQQQQQHSLFHKLRSVQPQMHHAPCSLPAANYSCAQSLSQETSKRMACIAAEPSIGASHVHQCLWTGRNKPDATVDVTAKTHAMSYS